MFKTYRVVPGPTMVATQGGNAQTKASGLYQDIINQMAGDGWTFVCFDDTLVKNTTCGCSTTTFSIKLLVFGRDA